ncbi:MAG: DUF5694 domain-containing protein [Flavobacterium sp.]|uniref:DUF5694 domain-containing protein n=1 Tax=Flavobacterium sp. TaxID=239 RepID=UPI0022C5B8BB|nr:DUF5694 domain-containing protein [Flavobacterium sp.]MCZ8197884.1 DUF5694 domain-containing protein [Flavobacterium sp.]
MKKSISKKIALFILASQFITAQTQKKPTEILVIGTYHFNNPGLDVAQYKVLDIMGEKPQKQLEEISTAIAKFKPTKIFTEWELKDQLALDTLYNKYQEGTYFEYVAKKYPKRKFYVQNEIVQLAFRAAKKSNLKKVFAIDYQETSFDFDSVMKFADSVRLPNFKKEVMLDIKNTETKSNALFTENDLLKCLYYYNSEELRKIDIPWYVGKINDSDKLGTYVGAFLASEWYRRNLYMLANIQKQTESSDNRIMVLAGASHITMFLDLLKHDSNYKIVELKEVMEKKR